MRRPIPPEFRWSLGLTAILVGFVLLPLVGALAQSWAFSGSGGPGLGESVGYLLRHYGSWLLFSLGVSLVALTVCLAVGVVSAYVLVCHPFPGSRLLEEVALLPLSLPGIALSIALVGAYGSWRGPWLVLAGHALVTLPFMIRIVSSALRTSDVGALEEAARGLGAGPWQRARLVVLPSLRHSILVGSLVVLAVSWGEFNVSYLLNRGELQTFPAALYNTFANETSVRSGAALLLFLGVALPLGLALQGVGGSGEAAGEEAA